MGTTGGKLDCQLGGGELGAHRNMKVEAVTIAQNSEVENESVECLGDK